MCIILISQEGFANADSSVWQFAWKQAHTSTQRHPVHAKSAGTAPCQSLCSGHITAAKICSEAAVLSLLVGSGALARSLYIHASQLNSSRIANLKMVFKWIYMLKCLCYFCSCEKMHKKAVWWKPFILWAICLNKIFSNGAVTVKKLNSEQSHAPLCRLLVWPEIDIKFDCDYWFSYLEM